MILTFLSTGLGIFLLVALARFLHKVWWTPIRVQHIMASQGIKGPAYRFLHGNTKEIVQMRGESIRAPMEFSSHNIFARIMPDIHAWNQLYGKNYLNWYGPQAHLVVTEPELIREIINNKDGAYLKGRLDDDFSKKLLGNGILVATGEKWTKLRKIANHAFYAESLKGMVPEMIASVDTMLERWRQHEEKEIEVYKESRLLTAEVISRTAFGSSYLEGEKIFDMLMKMGMIVARNRYRIRFPVVGKFLKSRDDLESDKIDQAIRESIIVMINKREEKMMRGEESKYGSDFLGSLITANHDRDEKNRISVDEMVDECKTFYLAGQETTNGVLAWSLFLLAIHTDWQEKARKEVFELFGQESPNAEGIARSKIMSMILNETLRLYSPVINLLRKVEREVRLGKLILPANTYVLLPVLALHHDPEIWGQDVHLFKPERFTDGVAKATNNNIAGFIPFGFGPRICVGLNFAANELKIALSMILQRYKFTLSSNYVHHPIHLITTRPKNGIPIVFNKL
jgi:PHYB activation tagged suppressor 1